jgi:hypothetical protein
MKCAQTYLVDPEYGMSEEGWKLVGLGDPLEAETAGVGAVAIV